MSNSRRLWAASPFPRRSPFLDEAELFPFLRPDEAPSVSGDATLYFEANCLTDASILIDPSSNLYTSPWTAENMRNFNPAFCTGFAAKDPLYMLGLRRLIQTHTADALELADAYAIPAAAAARSKSMEKVHFGSREMGNGILLSLVFFLSETSAAIDFATLVGGVMFGIASFMLLFQFFFLGNRVEKLLRDNAFNAMTLQVLLDSLNERRIAAAVGGEEGSEDSA